LISDAERKVLAEVQRLPLVPEPFAEVASRLDITENEVLDTCKGLMEKGVIRRFGASLAHRKFGFGSNPMCVLKVPDERLDEVGNSIASDPRVSHCYARSGWEYDIFFMVHAKTREEGIELAREIITKTGIDDYKLLFSTRELKKVSFELPREVVQ
jgi:DNA-binding Lrp family transcriptional regulator